jgi:Sensors of blue-light using FAD
MVRSAQILYKSVFLSVNNPRTPMSDTQDRVQRLCTSPGTDSVTGMVLAGRERWLCYFEGDALEITAMTAAIEQHERPRQWHMLMTDVHAKERMFPHRRIGWRNDCTPLEMAAFLSDLQRNPSNSQVWQVPISHIFELLEPVE